MSVLEHRHMRTIWILVTLLFFTGCDPCVNQIVRSVASPDEKYEATAFIRDCGATTDFSPQVFLRPKGKSVGKTGNVFVGNDSYQIRIRWLSSTQLAIYCDSRVSLLATNFEG